MYQRIAFKTVSYRKHAAYGAADLSTNQFGDKVVIANDVNGFGGSVIHLVEIVVRAAVLALIDHFRARFENRNDVVGRAAVFGTVFRRLRGFFEFVSDFKHSRQRDQILDGRQWADPHGQFIQLFGIDGNIIARDGGVDGVVTHVDILNFGVFFDCASVSQAVIQRAAIVRKVTTRRDFTFF